MENTMKLDTSTWKKVKLGDIIVKMPKASHAAKDALDSGKYPFFTNSASDKEFFIDDIDYNEPIILANTGGKAYFKYCDKPCGASRDLYVFKTISGVNTKWLYYQLKQLEEQVNEFGFAGAALKHLQKDYLHNLELSLPSEQEQLKIVNMLSSLDNLIEVRGGQRKMIVEQKSQLMTEIFNKQTPREEWKIVKLGNICTIKTGKLNANAAVDNGKYPFFTCAEEVSKIDEYAFDCDALLVAGNGNVGMVHSYKGKFNAYQRTYVLFDFKVNKCYVEQYLRTKLPDRVKEHIKGSAVPYIKLDCLTDMDILLPPEEDQLKIAKILSEYDELIQTKRTGLANIEKSKAQLMNSIFTERESLEWRTYRLGDIADYIRGVTYSKDKETLEGNNSYKLFRANNISLESSTLNFEDIKLIDKSVKVKEEQFLKTNDIMICAGSGSKEHVGKVAFIDKDMNYTIGGFMAIIRPKDIEPYYLYSILRSDIFRDYLRTAIGAASTINNLNSTIANNFEFTAPPLSEQKRIAKLLSEYDELIKTNDSESETLIKSKNQLMNSIFVERERV